MVTILCFTGYRAQCDNRHCFNTLASRKYHWNSRLNIFKHILVTKVWCIHCKMALVLTDDMSALVRAMAWCRQTTTHCLIQMLTQFLCRCIASFGHSELTHILNYNSAAKVDIIHVILDKAVTDDGSRWPR